jgi:maleylacetate reductase
MNSLDPSNVAGHTATKFRYEYPAIGRIVFGEPAASVVADECRRAGKERILILTSASMKESELVRAIVGSLGSRHAATFAQISTNSPSADILSAANLARAVSADLLVAVGGGSVMDAAKVVQLCVWKNLALDVDLEQYRGRELQRTDPGADPIRTIAVPTTMSAAEFASLAGSYNIASGRKETFDHHLFVPKVVVADPASLAQSPAALVVSTGIRTIDHCVERFCSTGAQPCSDALALGALKLLLRHLTLVQQGRASAVDYSQLQIAAWMSVSSVDAGVPVGASHAIGRVLGAVAGVPHGQTSAILLPAVLAWNAGDPKALSRQQQLADEMGMEGQLPHIIGDHIAALGQPRRLSSAGVRQDQFARIARDSMIMLKHPSVSGNPRRVENERDILEILDHAW